MDSERTVVVKLTPPGRAAIAVVLVAGGRASAVVQACFYPVSRRAPSEWRAGQLGLGRWGGPDGEELVVCRTAADQFEVHCHGGKAAIERICQSLRNLGCDEVQWRDWLRESIDDALRAEAQIALAAAPTLRVAAILLDQYHGALGRAVREAAGALESGALDACDQHLAELLRWEGLGQRLTRPWHVVLAGPPNVGKSSLINAIAGYERAIVSPTPGTTRDVVRVAAAIDGWPVELCDTAGLRRTTDEVEAAGVALASSMLAQADLVVLVRDATGSIPDDDFVSAEASRATRVLHVENKIDLVGERASSDGEVVRVSALAGDGVPELIEAISQALVPMAPARGEAVPFESQHFEWLASARRSLASGDRVAVAAALQSLLSGT